jgi:DNA-directed RNA polymerase specialized sigma24 family protein
MRTLVSARKKSLIEERRFERDLVSLLAGLAEQEAGYKPGKVGWLAWFGTIFSDEPDLLQKFRHVAEDWPPLEREMFEFYFVDHLALADIALLVGCTSQAFYAHLRFIQRRLREALVQEVLSESKVLAVDSWTLRLKCRSCGIARGQNAFLAMDQI